MFEHLIGKIRFLRKIHKEPYLSLYKILGFYPHNLSYYDEALRHCSCSSIDAHGRYVNNERMEFLGDAILDSVISDVIYHKYPTRHEGFLTSTRAKIVQRESLNPCALRMGLDKLLIYSPHLSSTHNNYIFGNALEALIAAVYLDRGYHSCFLFVRDVLFKKYISLDTIIQRDYNYKSVLIEWSQKNRMTISFDLIESAEDNDGSPIFTTGVVLAGEQIATGVGYSKKESHQKASKEALKRLNSDKSLEQSLIQKQQLLDKKSNEQNLADTDGQTDDDSLQDIAEES